PISLDKISEETITLTHAAEEIQKAYENGLHDGQITAKATYKTELNKYRKWIRRIDSVVDELIQKHRSELLNMHSDLVELSVMISENILMQEIQQDKSSILHMVKEAFDGIENERVFTFILNPDDIDIIKAARSELFKDL